MTEQALKTPRITRQADGYAIHGLSGLEEAVFVRMASVFLRFAGHGGERALLESLKAPTDVGTLAYIAVEEAATGPVEALDPTARLLAEGAWLKEELLRRAGGGMGATAVAALAGVSRQAVDKMRRTNRLIAVPRGRDYLFPAVQFTASGIVPGLDEALKALPIADPWMRLEWLMTEDDELEGSSPIAALQEGRLDAVMVNAVGYGGE